MDNESRSSLPGANIVLLSDTSVFTGATADVDGYFRMEKVPLGRHTLQFTYLGYEPMIISNIIVNSGKEVILTAKMEESVVKMKEVEVTASRGRGEAMNEMATISARAFSVEETERYAGSRGDPARMASNFAGCQGADDSRNDIVIRGNSPLGILWRVEGVDIPNPNHFAISGSAGGPVSILNNKVQAFNAGVYLLLWDLPEALFRIRDQVADVVIINIISQFLELKNEDFLTLCFEYFIVFKHGYCTYDLLLCGTGNISYFLPCHRHIQ